MKPDDLVRSRRNSLRYTGYDYAQAGWYFVTTFTQDRRCLFGTISDGMMMPSAIGAMVTKVWHQLPTAYAGVTLDAVQLMPDHVHGILFLGSDPSAAVAHTLSDVLRYFKGRTTTAHFAEVRRGAWPPVNGQLWQRGFQDRIIRSDRELDQLRRYIEGNPGRWWERRHG